MTLSIVIPSRKGTSVTAFTPRPTTSSGTRSTGLVRRLVGFVTPDGSAGDQDTGSRRRTMDRLIAELNRGA